MQIKTRRQAAEAGENKYYTGRPCVHGHDGPRYTSTGICCACNSAGVKAYNKRMQVTRNRKMAGFFVYPSHPEDMGALLAYAQALDLQRGRVPPDPSKEMSYPPPSMEDLARLRERAFGSAGALPPQALAATFSPPMKSPNVGEDELDPQVRDAHNAYISSLHRGS